MHDDLFLLIDGELVKGDATLDVIDPSTGSVFRTVPRASRAQLDEAVAAARRSFRGWKDTPLEDRRNAIRRLAGAIEERRQEFAESLVREQGKPLAQALAEVDWTTSFSRAYADLDLPVEVYFEDDEFRMEGHHRPLGVVAGIAPWNFPLFIPTLKLAAATLTGNTFIAKPAPTTPVAMLMLAQIAKGVFPPGVVNVLVDDNDLGPALVEHPDVDKISFTGSTETGKKIGAAAAAQLKRVSLELGGNDACIVLDDVDVKKVASEIYEASFANAGQICIAIKRIYADRSIYGTLSDAIAQLARAESVGNGLDKGVGVGPLQNRMQYEKAKDYLSVAREDGVVLAGGEVGSDGQGYFVQPTVVKDISSTSRLVTEEQFAPILPVLPFDDVQEAISAVNESDYGLGGSVWSSSIERARSVADQLETGTVWINHHLHLHPSVPVGGAKQSGIGVDYGVDGLRGFTQTTVVRIAKMNPVVAG